MSPDNNDDDIRAGGAGPSEAVQNAAPPSDADLLGRIAAGRDVAAFEALFHRYAGRIKGLLIKGGASAGEADEIAQEAMLAVWRKADQFDMARAGASTWIFTIARNRRIDMIRRARRPVPDPNDPLFHPDPEPSAETGFANAERDARLRKAVADLNGDQRTAVRLAFFEGLSHPEIAARTGAPLGTIKSRLRLAADRLRAALGDDFGEELFND